MDDSAISIEELWIQLQIRNIKSLKLYRNHHIMREKWYGDLSDVVWKNLITRQHDAYNFQNHSYFEVYTLDIDKVESFLPLKVKGYDPLNWYFMSCKPSWLATNGQAASYQSNQSPKKYQVDFRWKNELLLVNQFNIVDELSGDRLLNW